MPPQKSIFVTVGTTRYDALVACASHPIFLSTAASLGYSLVVIQHGHGPAPSPQPASQPAVSSYSLKASISPDMLASSLVISHAGAGSVFEALRSGKRLLVACNPALADNHQQELAAAMALGGHCAVAGDPLTPTSLAAGLREAATRSFHPLPPPDAAALQLATQAASSRAALVTARSKAALYLMLLLAALLFVYSLVKQR